LGAANDAAHTFHPGSSLAAIMAERHRFCWNSGWPYCVRAIPARRRLSAHRMENEL